MSSNDDAVARTTPMSSTGQLLGRTGRPGSRDVLKRTARRSDSGKGAGRESDARSTVNIADVAPMPNASVATATVVNPRAFQRPRAVTRRSVENQVIVERP